MTDKRQRVAVIGTGLAGLATAYLLSETPEDGSNDFEVHVFEKSPTIGFDGASSVVTGSDGKQYNVDMPMRALQGGERREALYACHNSA